MDYKYFWSVRMEYKKYWQTCFKYFIAPTQEAAIKKANELRKETDNDVYVLGPHIHWEHYNV